MLLKELNFKLKQLSTLDNGNSKFLCYKYYKAISPHTTLGRNKPNVVVFCSRHNCRSVTKIRYLLGREKVCNNTQCCPMCHYGDNFPTNRRKFLRRWDDVAQVLVDVDHEFRFEEPIDEVEWVENAHSARLKCKKCGNKKTHNVSNIMYLRKEPKHIRCQVCSSNRIGAKAISYEVANTKGFTICKSSYTKLSEKCIGVCNKCQWRQWVMLNRVKPNACVFCSDNPNNVIKSLVDETALHEFVDRLPGSNWRISRSIVDVKHNKVTYNNHVLHNLDGYLVVECKIHPHSKKKVQIRGSFRQEITSYSCRECGGNKCRRYTPKLINSQIATLGLPNTIIVDICKSGLKNELEKIAPQMHLYLKCSIHGEVSRPLTTYAITKKIKNSVNKGFCNRCSPSAGYYINPKRVRDYFESEERIRTYGAKYKALISDEVMQELFDDAIEQGKQPWLVPIPVLITPIGLSWHGGVMEPFKSSVSFAAFKKGSSKITHLRGGSCFLAKVFALLNHKYNLGFSNEVKFKGLLTNKANPIRVDFFNEHLGIAIEIDGAQHIELMPSVGTVKEQKKKLSSQRERDARVNDYFDRHSSYRLYRVPCYHKTQKSTRSLSKSEQFDSALSIAKKLHLLVHGSVLPVHEFNIDDLLYSYEDYCDRLDERHNILYTIYDKFSANIDSFFYNNGKLYYSVTCKNGHRHVYAYKTHYYHRDKKEFCKACKQLSKVSL